MGLPSVYRQDRTQYLQPAPVQEVSMQVIASRSCLHPACMRLMHCTAVQTFFDALLESTGLKDTLRNGDGNYTILAPHNSAWSQALIQNTLDCTTDFYITSECNDIQDLLTATNLKDILLGHSEASQAPAYTDVTKPAPLC